MHQIILKRLYKENVDLGPNHLYQIIVRKIFKDNPSSLAMQ